MRSTAREDRRRDRFTRFTLPVLRDIPWAALLAAGVLKKSGLREVLVSDSAELEHLRAEARYHRERRDLYRAKMYGPRATDRARTRELERICDAAETRLAHAERQAAHPGSDDSEEAR